MVECAGAIAGASKIIFETVKAKSVVSYDMSMLLKREGPSQVARVQRSFLLVALR
jgi:hypothetical protein